MGCCHWDGPMWPFETAKALTAMIQMIQSGYTVPNVTKSNFWTLMSQYTKTHTGSWIIADERTGKPINNSLIAKYFLSGLGDSWIAEAGCADDATWTDNALQGYLSVGLSVLKHNLKFSVCADTCILLTVT
eukprot:m.92185 g.92185  ORF g.92185 m.92185 type:complete len:131 (+) comp13341_c0_seq1:1406-1798(+)